MAHTHLPTYLHTYVRVVGGQEEGAVQALALRCRRSKSGGCGVRNPRGKCMSLTEGAAAERARFGRSSANDGAATTDRHLPSPDGDHCTSTRARTPERGQGRRRHGIKLDPFESA